MKEYRRDGSNIWPRGYEPRALPLRHSGKECAVFNVTSIDGKLLMIQAGSWGLCGSTIKRPEVKEYPRLVLIQLPQGYEPCALPMRHAGEWGLFNVTSIDGVVVK